MEVVMTKELAAERLRRLAERLGILDPDPPKRLEGSWEITFPTVQVMEDRIIVSFGTRSLKP